MLFEQTKLSQSKLSRKFFTNYVIYISIDHGLLVVGDFNLESKVQAHSATKVQVNLRVIYLCSIIVLSINFSTSDFLRKIVKADAETISTCYRRDRVIEIDTLSVCTEAQR